MASLCPGRLPFEAPCAASPSTRSIHCYITEGKPAMRRDTGEASVLKRHEDADALLDPVGDESRCLVVEA